MTNLTLRVSGLGHTLTLVELDSDATTVGGLKAKIHEQTGLPPCYQRLVSRGLKLDNDCDNLSLEQAGVKDRTKLTLLHSALYAQEKESFEALTTVSKEIDELSASVKDLEVKVVSELVTRLCCKLDAIDTAGSDYLRVLRKELLQKAENIELTFKQSQSDDTTTPVQVDPPADDG